MALLIHIIIALCSLAYTTSLVIKPLASKLPGAYVLLALTILSGVILVLIKPADLTQACTTGLVYMTVVIAGIGTARHRLVTE